MGEHLPSSHPPLPTLRLPNDRLVLALGDFGLGLSQAADAEEGQLCKTDRTLNAPIPASCFPQTPSLRIVA